jgi:predicted O-methyltransferase YrrM
MTSKKDKFYVMRDYTLINGLLDLITHIAWKGNTKEMHMIEIGSYTGDSTLVFAEHFRSVLAIDPFIDDYDPEDDACNYAPFDQVYEEFIRKTKDVANMHLIRKTSDEAVEAIKKAAKSIDPRNLEEENLRAFDFIYIDGMHTYDQVKKDIVNYMPLLREGGFIGGHDYADNKKQVMDAVNEIIGQPDAVFQDTSWIKQV